MSALDMSDLTGERTELEKDHQVERLPQGQALLIAAVRNDLSPPLIPANVRQPALQMARRTGDGPLQSETHGLAYEAFLAERAQPRDAVAMRLHERAVGAAHPYGRPATRHEAAQRRDVGGRAHRSALDSPEIGFGSGA